MSSDYPPGVIAAAREAARRHPSNIDAAVAETLDVIRRFDDFADFRDTLVYRAVKDLVYASRHTANVQMRREAGRYGGGAKVNQGRSEAVNRVCESQYYAYCI